LDTITEVRPLADRVFVRRLDTESETTDGGIIIPDNAQEMGDAAEVVAVGRGGLMDGEVFPIELDIGQKVLINRFSGTEVVFNGESCLVLRESDILAKITD
jgi:chaperonin GroES|tara:strand:- start:622 stop:924 length:303 start_codon:yes stop_codon:yes gene_type:complete